VLRARQRRRLAGCTKARVEHSIHSMGRAWRAWTAHLAECSGVRGRPVAYWRQKKLAQGPVDGNGWSAKCVCVGEVKVRKQVPVGEPLPTAHAKSISLFFGRRALDHHREPAESMTRLYHDTIHVGEIYQLGEDGIPTWVQYTPRSYPGGMSRSCRMYLPVVINLCTY
jgi:hypothetical protein